MSERYIPDGHGYQVGSFDFKFNIITNSPTFRSHVAYSIENDLFRDICDDSLSNLTQEEIELLPRELYPNVVQKSATWLTLRNMAQGTASSAGKYIDGPTTYPSRENIRESWADKINEKPFSKTHTMLGHMNWGVGYEDPALVHFAIHQGVSVAAVGTVRLDLSEIIDLGKTYFKQDLTGILNVPGVHLLISPDGLVGKPEQSSTLCLNPKTTLHSELIGMLEIKCISPFHHVEIEEEFLEWVDNMDTRQWYNSYDIPFVYIMQIGLQAIAGVTAYNMTDDHTMWFVRWSPHGFSKFTINFGPLIRLGISGALLYLSLVQRTNSLDDILNLFPYTEKNELIYYKMLCIAYDEIMQNMKHEYVTITDYPEFDVYRQCTEYFRFKVGEIDHGKLLTFPDSTGAVADIKDLELDLDDCVL